MTDFTITAMRIIDAEPNPSGSRVLASYDLNLAGMHLTGCVLTADADGLVSARGIRGRATKGVKISAQNADGPDRDQGAPGH